MERGNWKLLLIYISSQTSAKYIYSICDSNNVSVGLSSGHESESRLLDGMVSPVEDRDLLAKASKHGLIDLTDSSFYGLPSPLHRQIWSYKLIPLKGYKYPGDILALTKDTVAKFRPYQLSRSDQRAETDKRDPPEAQYSHEWYRSLHEVTGGNVVISPEYAWSFDFYIPSMKWGIELLRDGDKPREHNNRFLTGAYSDLVISGAIVDYALLDFRHTLPSPG